MNKQHIINEIKRTAEANGDIPLGMDRFYAETGIRRPDWYGKYWARWGDALVEAGYSPNKLKGSYEDGWVIEKLVSLIKELKKFPSSGDIRMKTRQEKGFPCHTVFNRVGKRAELIEKTIEYCSKIGGLEDVLEICQTAAIPVPQEADNSLHSNSALGYVYLIKSGKFYKIGRTNAIGRREYELGIQLPDKATTVHIIKTDDPNGIEAYWHRRFQDRRKNGEWFELTTADVNAFKRRKFM